MRVLLDESLPRPLAKLLTGHEVRTVAELRWMGLKNGVLLTRAASSFDVVLTADQNIEFQQNLTKLPVAVVVLVANTNGLNPWNRSFLSCFAFSPSFYPRRSSE